MEGLITGSRQLGLTLTPVQLERFAMYGRELLVWNERVNLTAITRPAEIETKHFLDSLSLLVLPFATGARLIDVGAGAGFPGLPLAIARPDLHVVLLESIAKKAAFLEHVVARLELLNVEVIASRAEELGHQPGYRAAFEVATARAVGGLATLAELLLPFCTLGGLAVAPKKGAIEAEIEAARPAIERLGGALRPTITLQLPGLAESRFLVVIEKVRPTPPAYPRRAGIPAKRPLH